MIRKLAQSITEYWIRKDAIAKEDAEIYEYGLVCKIGSLVQVALILMTTSLLGLVPQAIAYFLAFAILKRDIGGYHATSQLSCNIISVAMISLFSWLATLIASDWHLKFGLIALLIMIMLVLCKAPVIHHTNPKTPQQYRDCRKRAVATALKLGMALVVLMVLMPPCSIVSAGVFGGLTAAITLFLPLSKRKGAIK